MQSAGPLRARVVRHAHAESNWSRLKWTSTCLCHWLATLVLCKHVYRLLFMRATNGEHKSFAIRLTRQFNVIIAFGWTEVTSTQTNWPLKSAEFKRIEPFKTPIKRRSQIVIEPFGRALKIQALKTRERA